MRLDELLVSRGLSLDIKAAQTAILAGEVFSGTQRMEHAGTTVLIDQPIEVRERGGRFASRAGEKLQAALESFRISVKDKVCLDVGSSTGGFTDCLLQNGAKSVFAVDVGYGLIDSKLRANSRVHLLERTNARLLNRNELIKLSPDADNIGFLTIDVSFISLGAVMPAVVECIEEGAEGVVLFKPQFEAERSEIRQGGVVTEEGSAKALEDFELFCKREGYRIQNELRSPVAGKKSGNIEILIHLGF